MDKLTQASSGQLHESLKPLLLEKGFSETAVLTFARTDTQAEQLLLFGGRIDPASRQYLFSFNVAVRFLLVQKLFDQIESNQISAILNVPIHLLHEDKKYVEWELQASIDKEFGTILDEVENYASPFFAHFGQLPNLEKALQSPDPQDWFTLSSQQRICMLAAIRYTEGNRTAALLLLEEELKLRVADPPKRKKDIQDLRNRLAAMQ